MNALLVNPYTKQWATLGSTIPRPKAILSVSAHWYVQDAAVTVSTSPRTIHDFGGSRVNYTRCNTPLRAILT